MSTTEEETPQTLESDAPSELSVEETSPSAIHAPGLPQDTKEDQPKPKPSLMSTMNRDVPDEYIKKYKEAFNVFANKQGEIDTADSLPILLRGCLKNPRTEQLKDWVSRIDPKNTGLINYDQFLCIINQKDLADVDSATELRDCFEMFDEMGSGEMNSGYLRSILASIGEKEMTDDQIRYMLKEAEDPDEPDKINYNEFIELMTKTINPLIPMKKAKKGGKKKAKG